MQHFISAVIVIILCLTAPISQAQNNPNPPNNPAPLSAPEHGERPRQHNDSKPDNEETNKHPDAVPLIDNASDDVAVDDSVIKVAKKANFWSMLQTIFNGTSLVLIGFATWFAWGAWQEGKEAVKVGKAESMPNVQIRDIRHEPLIFHEGDNMRAFRLGDCVICSIEFNVANLGRTTAKKVTIEMQAKIRANSTHEWIAVSAPRFETRRVIDEPPSSTLRKRSLEDIPPTAVVPIRQGFDTPFGDALTFVGENITAFSVHRIELNIVLRYTTVLGEAMAVAQTFGMRAFEKDGVVERVTYIEEQG